MYLNVRVRWRFVRAFRSLDRFKKYSPSNLTLTKLVGTVSTIFYVTLRLLHKLYSIQDTQSTGFHRTFCLAVRLTGIWGPPQRQSGGLHPPWPGQGAAGSSAWGPGRVGENRVSDMKYWPGFPIIFFYFVRRCYIYCNYHCSLTGF